jgi:hypothetical protein
MSHENCATCDPDNGIDDFECQRGIARCGWKFIGFDGFSERPSNAHSSTGCDQHAGPGSH